MKKDINFRHATTLAAATVEISNSSAAYMKLLDLLINVTHHDGALEEYKEVWLPIIQDELERRQKELSAEERAADVAYANSHASTHFEVGKSLVVEMTVVNADTTWDLLRSKYAEADDHLIAGCRVIYIHSRGNPIQDAKATLELFGRVVNEPSLATKITEKLNLGEI